MVFRDNIIIISSDEPFSPVWHTQIQYAKVLSETNKVIYIDPPDQWRLSSLFKFKPEIRQLKDDFILYKYKNILPVTLGAISTKINDFINSKILYKKFIKNHFDSQNVLIWQFDPFRFIKPSFNYWKSIYHVIDPFFKREFDKILARNANLVIVTSPKFETMYRELNKNVINVPQAYLNSENKYNGDLKIPNIKNYFIIIGTFSNYIDYNLLLSIIKSGINVLAIGPIKITSEEKMNQWNTLLTYSGFEYIGVIHFSDLNFYISKSLGGLICYDFISKGLELDKNSSPLKAINYLANNKLIISTVDVEISSLNDIAIFTENKHDLFIEKLKKVSNNEVAMPLNEIKNYLDSITYEKFIDKIYTRVAL